MPAAATLNSLATDWSALMVAVLWQSTILAGIVAVLAWLLRRSSPAVRYWLWQIVAIKILLAPLWTQVVPLPWLPSEVVDERAEPTPAPRDRSS